MSTERKKFSWAGAFAPKRTTIEPVELPDISTCPYAYANEPPPEAHRKSEGSVCNGEIPIGISPINAADATSDPFSPSLHSRKASEATQTTRSSSVMIMYVKSWLPGSLAPEHNNDDDNDHRAGSVRASSVFNGRGPDPSIGQQSRPPYPYDMTANSSTSSVYAWQQRMQQQKQQQEQQEQRGYYQTDDRSAIAPLALYADRKFSYASNASSAYEDMLDEPSSMSNTATRISAARIPNPPRNYYR